MYKVEIENEYKGYKYVVLFTEKGYRCGYVGVKNDNPLYGHSINEKLECLRKTDLGDQDLGKRNTMLILFEDDPSDDKTSPQIYFDVHGSLTYAKGEPNYPVASDLWWYGFECNHHGDRSDPDKAFEYGLFSKSILEIMKNDFFFGKDEQIASMEYVEQECMYLIDQMLRLDLKVKLTLLDKLVANFTKLFQQETGSENNKYD
jgi:hypothetical protein